MSPPRAVYPPPLPISAPADAASTSQSATPTVPTALQGKQFTLVTGDVVTVAASGDGARIDVEPAPGRERVGFLRTQTGEDDISVIPTDVAPLVASGKVDEQLFNLSALERFGYDDKADGTKRTGDQQRGKLRALTVEASFDGGTTWKKAPVVKSRALIQHPDLAMLSAEHIDRNEHGYVSLRVKGADRVSSFEVTVKKAYKLKKS